MSTLLTSPAGITATLVLIGVFGVKAMYRINQNEPDTVTKIGMTAIVLGILGFVYWGFSL